MTDMIPHRQSASSKGYRNTPGGRHHPGPIVAKHIGLTTLRSKCTHFGAWFDKLEALNEGWMPLETD